MVKVWISTRGGKVTAGFYGGKNTKPFRWGGNSPSHSVVTWETIEACESALPTLLGVAASEIEVASLITDDSMAMNWIGRF
jgi:hypothetical protein